MLSHSKLLSLGGWIGASVTVLSTRIISPLSTLAVFAWLATGDN